MYVGIGKRYYFTHSTKFSCVKAYICFIPPADYATFQGLLHLQSSHQK